MSDAQERILDAALEVLGKNPDAGIGNVAAAAGVVRRTVYGYFPTRTDLIMALMQRAVSEIAAMLAEITATREAADQAWVDFVARLWPLAHRYRVLVALRRGEYGKEIHSLLRPVEKTLADLVERGQDSKSFGRHLPADVLSEVAFAAVFAIADNDLSHDALGARAATMTSLLMLGVPEARARSLVEARP